MNRDNDAEKRLRAEERGKEICKRLEEWHRDTATTSFAQESSMSRLEKGIDAVIREANEMISENSLLLDSKSAEAIKKATGDLLEKLGERKRLFEKRRW